jgi:hypothetical protein
VDRRDRGGSSESGGWPALGYVPADVTTFSKARANRGLPCQSIDLRLFATATNGSRVRWLDSPRPLTRTRWRSTAVCAADAPRQIRNAMTGARDDPAAFDEQMARSSIKLHVLH